MAPCHVGRQRALILISGLFRLLEDIPGQPAPISFTPPFAGCTLACARETVAAYRAWR